ncbi:neuronal membrane glycoprotein M6-a isoform X2 [Penaeus vannamei]|uniref:neuronal membrane glycoprotein M6-a isoform X2 n=1 Tax=Penaeus vannamei TaxID=6689 RepID=UPI00387F4466
MSQWGGHNGGPGQWHDRDAYYARDDQHHPHTHGRLAPPLPRPPMPPQHYPGHDGQTHPNHTHQHASDHSQHPSHNHAYHSHGANHAHHGQHSRHQSSSGSTRQLVHAESTEGYRDMTSTRCGHCCLRLGSACDCSNICYYCCCCCCCCWGGRKCRDCMTRVPYATLIATMMCCVGVGVFCGTMYRGTTLTLRMFEEVFKLRVIWVEPVQLTFMVVGAGMGGLGLMILFVGCLSTGDTRNKVYRTWRGRVGGRISCAIFMGITYLLSLAWLLMFAAIIIVTLFYTLAWLQCQYIPQNDCIDYNQFSFLFPEGTPEEDKRVCDGEKKLFCKDYVNNAEIMFILASVSSFLVILSLVHYLMCLAANYAHIKDQEKFMDLQEIQFLQESEMSTLPKDRF